MPLALPLAGIQASVSPLTEQISYLHRLVSSATNRHPRRETLTETKKRTVHWGRDVPYDPLSLTRDSGTGYAEVLLSKGFRADQSSLQTTP